MRRFRWLLVLFLPAIADAALDCKVQTADLHLRRNAPIPVVVELINDAAGLIEGRLEASILHRDRRVGVQRSTELVLSPGSRRVPLLLPPPPNVENGDGVAIHLRFVGPKLTADLGDHRLGSYDLAGYEFVIAVARTERRLNSVDIERIRSAHPESLRPLLENRTWFSSAESSMAVENLPTDPSFFCPYDALVLDGPAFAAMREKQLVALQQWLDGGGAAVILADVPLHERHLTFLNAIGRDSSVVFQLTAQNRLSALETRRLSTGLGRVLVAPGPPETSRALNGKPWRGHIAWLWGMPGEIISHVEKEGTWPANRERIYDGWRKHQLHTWVQKESMGFSDLAPDRPRPLPLGIVVLLLGTLLLLAGPADWFILGWLRRRRWTWLLFPSFCLASAWCASHLAGRFLGRETRTGSLHIVDIGPGNRLLKETTLHLRMPAHDEEWIAETSGPLAAAMSTPDESDFPIALAEDPRPSGIPELRTEWLTPSRLRLHQNLRQWTPAWRQFVRFPTATADNEPNWDSLIAHWQEYQTLPPDPPPGYRLQAFLPDDNDTASSREWAPEDPRLPTQIGEYLFSGFGRVPGLIGHPSPLSAGTEAFAQPIRGALGLLAWRKVDTRIFVFRRHVSAQELRRRP